MVVQSAASATWFKWYDQRYCLRQIPRIQHSGGLNSTGMANFDFSYWKVDNTKAIQNHTKVDCVECESFL